MAAPGEYAPPARKVRVTRKQLRQIQENYRIAQMRAQDNSEIEAEQRKKELAYLEAELDAIPDNYKDDLILEDTNEIKKYLLNLVSKTVVSDIFSINKYLSLLEDIGDDFYDKFEQIRQDNNIDLYELFLGIDDIEVNHMFVSEEELKEIKIIADKAFSNNFLLIDNKVCEYDMDEGILKISENTSYYEKMRNRFLEVWSK